MTRPGIEPMSPGPLANTLAIRPIPNMLTQINRRKDKIVSSDIYIYIYTYTHTQVGMKKYTNTSQ